MLRPAATKSRTMKSGQTIGAKSHSHHAVGELSLPNLTNGIRMPYNGLAVHWPRPRRRPSNYGKRSAAAVQCSGGLATAAASRGATRMPVAKGFDRAREQLAEQQEDQQQ